MRVGGTSDNEYYVNCVGTKKEGLESLGGAIRARGKKSLFLLIPSLAVPTA
jgi:hypothetical protein